MLHNPKWDGPSLSGFISFLESKDPNQKYDFNNSCGECLMGQYMAYHGFEWNFDVYGEFCNNILYDRGATNLYVLTAEPQTFGGALNRAYELAENLVLA